ncbi:MAG: discoidin domain-containing protein [Prevotellaceae bacterium]|jgi:hypothetical protein|nr:discoidin domain-containing protein [Prevotellaceae bacterium]
MKLIYLLSIFLIFISCNSSPRWSAEIEEVLRMASDNRKELETVLLRYKENPADSLKFRAAEFLIVNMPDKYSEYFDAPWNDVAAALMRVTSSKNEHGIAEAYRLENTVIEEDIKCITAEYLINNIELAFKVWQEMPWCKHVPFEVFCEDILPYRVGVEPLENWRKKALATFDDLYKSFMENQSITSVEACSKINEVLPRFKLDWDFPPMSFSQLMASARGPCDNMAVLAIFSMRALGVPVTHESTPKWAEYPRGHSWNAVRDSAGNYISFMGTDSNPYSRHQGNDAETSWKKGKVYRKTFAKQCGSISENEDIPATLTNIRNMKDVSVEYEDCRNTVKIHLKYPPEKPVEHVYLALGDKYGEKMYPVALVKKSDSIAEFSYTGGDIMYFPVYYINHTYTSAGDPFWLDKAGNIHVFSPDSPNSPDTTITVTELDTPDYGTGRMLHGVFEGANKPDFSDAEILHIINHIPKADYNEVILKYAKKYRYVRYKSPPRAYCNVAEIEFYGQNGDKLNGKNIGISGSWNNTGMTSDKAFDGDITTFYDAELGDDAWTGLDFQESKQIRKIRYVPRSNEGHRYKVFYWSANGWKSSGEYIATNNSIQCRVPSRALMYIYNVTLKSKEKVFFME